MLDMPDISKTKSTNSPVLPIYSRLIYDGSNTCIVIVDCVHYMHSLSCIQSTPNHLHYLILNQLPPMVRVFAHIPITNCPVFHCLPIPNNPRLILRPKLMNTIQITIQGW